MPPIARTSGRSPSKPRESEEPLGAALLDFVRHPVSNLIEIWNWKAAAISALIRGAIFLFTNLRSGSHRAVRAMLVEVVFAIFAAGIMGAMTQRLRFARPIAATGLIVWLAMPAGMLAAEAAAHHLFGTPHLRVGLTASFVLASVASGFGWFVQRRGVMLAGRTQNSVAYDLRALPAIMRDFLLALPRAIVRWRR